MKKSKYFKIHELVSPSMLEKVHEDVLWKMFNPQTIDSIDRIKEKFNNGSVTINSYKFGGNRTESGLRTKDSSYYSSGSQHSVGCAFDMVFSKYDANEVREYIVANRDEFPGITRVEGKVSWLHIDSKDTGLDEIYIFKA